MEQAVARRLKADQELRRACEESTLAGDLLLKAEGKELERVNQYAEDLMKREYRWGLLRASVVLCPQSMSLGRTLLQQQGRSLFLLACEVRVNLLCMQRHWVRVSRKSRM